MKPFLYTMALCVACSSAASAEELVDQFSEYLEEFNQLVLPDNPTPEQSEAYVKEHIRILASTKNYPLANRLARKMDLEKRFDAIPNRDIHLLFEQVDEFILVRETVARVIEKRDPKDYKAFVIAGLDDHPNNIIAIKHHGWYPDAKEPILRQLEESVTMPPLAWWQAFVEVAEPKHYAKLKQLVLTDDDNAVEMAFLEMLPGYDMLATRRANIAAIDKRIEQIEAGLVFGCPVRQRFYLRDEMAVAAQAGDVQMLGRLIDQLDDPGKQERVWFYQTNRIDMWRKCVRQVIDAKGSNKEIRAWYEAHQKDLIFNNFTKRFTLIEDF